jgi:hypothetical protein
MSGSDIALGKPTPRKIRTPVAGSSPSEHDDDRRKAGVQQPRRVHCGAMSQQRDDSGSQSMPQKLVQLVGCHDPEAGSHKAGSSEAVPPKAKAHKSKTRIKR